MLTIKKIRFKGIGRFVDLQEIDLTSLGHLVQIDGVNKNTGGSSGAAKSTVCNAIDYLFGLNSIPDSRLQSRLTDDHIFVEAELELDGIPLVVTRGKKLKIDLDGKITTGSNKVAEEELDKILAIPRELFRPMLHKKQGEKGFFLGLKPSEMNSFLTDILGLGSYRNKIAILDTKLNETNALLSMSISAFESSRAAFKASQEAKVALGSPPVKEVDQNAVSMFKSHAESSERDLNALLAKQKKEEELFLEENSPVPDAVRLDTTEKDRLEEELRKLRVALDEVKLKLAEDERCKDNFLHVCQADILKCEAAMQRGKEAKDRVAKLADDVKRIREERCPRCEQPWSTDSAKVDEAKTLKEILELKNVMLAGEKMAESIEHIRKAKAEFLASVPDERLIAQSKDVEGKIRAAEQAMKVESDKLQALLQEQGTAHMAKQEIFTSKFKELKKKHELDLRVVRGGADLSRRALDNAVAKMRNYGEALVRYNDSIDKLTQQERQHEEKVEGLLVSMDQIKVRVDELVELKRAIKSYLSHSFDEVLETIGENATRMIRNIPNMQNATIQLLGTRETKEGRVKEEVNTVVHMDGEESVPLQTLSGGEKASVDLAVDLAVLGLIEERTGKGINVFFLDEPFSGLEATNIEMVLEVLKNANVNKKIFVIDHNPIVKEQISDRITVVREGLTSRIA